MYWNAVVFSVIAALALPVVGLITGRVVGDFFLRGDLIGAIGAGFGVLVYALALASSYSHLRHYYKGYEAQGVRASWALALAVEVATFYMSFGYVVIHSAWAFWGSLIGAFVVFWGNLSSMYEARVERLQAASSTPFGESTPPRSEEAGPFQEMEALYEERVSEVRQAVRAMRVAQDVRREQAGEPAPTVEADPTPLSETDREVLRLAATEPVGPSAIARALGIAKSSAGDRLKRLERMGLLVRQGSSYVAWRGARMELLIQELEEEKENDR